MPKSTEQQHQRTTNKRWIAPRSGGYRPGGEFSQDSSRTRASAPVTPPKGSGGVVPGNRK